MAINNLRGEQFSMTLLQKIIEHFQNLVLVSDISMIFMGVSIILISAAYIYCVVIKKNKYEDIIIIIGVIVRILMVIGFTIEFLHQKAICEGIFRVGIDKKFNAIEQFSNYLFYGYICVIGVYSIFTIGINKFRGFFHTFDLTMVSIPILYGLTSLIINFEFNKDTFLFLIMLVYSMGLPYLFFKLFWKQNLKWYGIFFSYSSVFVLYVVANLVTQNNVYMVQMLWMSVPISYFLLGMYELCRHLFNKIRGAFSFSVWIKLKITSIILPGILIYSSIIALNFTPMQINKTYNIDSIYKEDATFTSLEEAENLARIAVEDTTSNIKLWYGTTENFNNRYMFSIGNYSVDIDGATGKIFEIKNQNKNEIEIYEIIDEEGIKEKTIKWLKNIGVTYDERQLEMKVERESNKYIVNIFNKFDDGSIDNNQYCSIQWNTNGRIYSANLGSTLFNIKDYKEIKINEIEIRENINKWYEKLEEETPNYIIKNLQYWFGDTEPSINILCKNNDGVQMNYETGQIISFSRNTNQNHDGEDNITKMTNEDYNKFKSIAKEKASLISANWNKFNYKLTDGYPGSEENGYYSFETSNNALIKDLTIQLDSKGNITSFNEGYKRVNEYSDKDFKVSSSTALKLVSNKFNSFGIYTKRVKLAIEIKEDGEVNYKWMVMVIPFKTAEHQIYYVDTDTGEITSLLNYN
jgi:hypothetical protein